jgi:hypothetical protein
LEKAGGGIILEGPRESKRKQLHYRKATFISQTGKSLQSLVEEAIIKSTPVKVRFQSLDDGTEDGWLRFINTHRSALGMQFGNLVLYAPDQSKHMIAINEQADELDIELIAPLQSADGKKRQFLESLLYYGILDNHVILLQSMALKARDLEGYLTWLLINSGVIGKDNAVFLNNFIPTLTQERLDKSEVKSVRIGTPLFNQDLPLDYKNNDQSEDKAKKVRFQNRIEGWEVLRTLISDRISDISWKEMQAANDLEVFIEVTYKRQVNELSQKALNHISSALRHVSDDDIKIELKGGGVVVGTELQVKNYISIDTYGGIVDQSDLFQKMQSWLISILEEGLIDAD